MSQSHNPTDTQGLLQSMLQRLKLQPGGEGQSLMHTPAPTTTATAWKQHGEREASNSKNVQNRPINGFDVGTNGIPSNEVEISAAESSFGIEGGEVQQLSHGHRMDRGFISLPSQKDNTDSGDGSRVLGEVTSPAVTPTATGQLFPATSLKGPDITSSEETDGEGMTYGTSATSRHNNDSSRSNDAATNLGQNHIKDQGFTPKVYAWSLRPTDGSADPESQGNRELHVGNGGFGALSRSKNIQFVASSQNTTNSSMRRKQRSSENKPRRWTQKIKERWMDTAGSFGKKGKEVGGRMDQKNMQGTELLHYKQLLTTTENISHEDNKEEERTLLLLDSSDLSETPTETEEAPQSTIEERIRSSSDFEFGLGSFSLLEEIVTGQEWAKFLNPNLPAPSANHIPSEGPPSQLKSQPNSSDNGQTSLVLKQPGGGNVPWNLRSTECSPDASLPVSMDTSEEKTQQDIHRAADQSEPMEDWQPGDRNERQQNRPASHVERDDILVNSALKRVHHNRKRQHHLAEADKRPHTGKRAAGQETGRGESISSMSLNHSQAMDETGESQHDIIKPPNSINSPISPLSPSFKSAPRGVLKKSISVDSESSMETVTKRRRVEENRRVHFSEDVETIEPPELDLDATVSEEDTEADDDSVIERDWELEQPEREETTPAAAVAAAAAAAVARRPALPAWIQALKRKNTMKKYRL